MNINIEVIKLIGKSETHIKNVNLLCQEMNISLNELINRLKTIGCKPKIVLNDIILPVAYDKVELSMIIKKEII